MAKFKLTKNELKKQKDDLKRFTRYLPTLELKKKQLLQEIRKIQKDIEQIESDSKRIEEEVSRWVDVFSDNIDLFEYIKIQEIQTGMDNVAGIDIPVFKDLIFEEIPVDFFMTPVWIDKGIAVCKEQIQRRIRREIAEQQEQILQDELRTTIQRIKLFEEVMIPNAGEAIRMIQIFLGDLQTAEVVRGKIAKAKIEQKKEQAAA